eukprot:1160581-Pelagomonas_calceolata.AAC.17
MSGEHMHLSRRRNLTKLRADAYLCVAPGPNDEANKVVAWVLIHRDFQPSVLLFWAVVGGGLVVGVVLNEFRDNFLQLRAR